MAPSAVIRRCRTHTHARVSMSLKVKSIRVHVFPSRHSTFVPVVLIKVCPSISNVDSRAPLFSSFHPLAQQLAVFIELNTSLKQLDLHQTHLAL